MKAILDRWFVLSLPFQRLPTITKDEDFLRHGCFFVFDHPETWLRVGLVPFSWPERLFSSQSTKFRATKFDSSLCQNERDNLRIPQFNETPKINFTSNLNKFRHLKNTHSSNVFSLSQVTMQVYLNLKLMHLPSYTHTNLFLCRLPVSVLTDWVNTCLWRTEWCRWNLGWHCTRPSTT